MKRVMADKVAFLKRKHVRNAEGVAHKVAFIQFYRKCVMS